MLQELHKIIANQYDVNYKIVSGYELETDDIANMLALKNNSILISEEGTSVNVSYESNSFITITDYILYISLKDFKDCFEIYNRFVSFLLSSYIEIDEVFYKIFVQKINKSQKEKLITIYLQIIES